MKNCQEVPKGVDVGFIVLKLTAGDCHYPCLKVVLELSLNDLHISFEI